MNVSERVGRRHIWWTYVLRGSGQGGASNAALPPPVSVVFSGRPFNVSSLWFQLFVIVVWNFELYMIPLALLLPLAWNYILIVSGKDTRQDVVSNPRASVVPAQWRIKSTATFLEPLNQM